MKAKLKFICLLCITLFVLLSCDDKDLPQPVWQTLREKISEMNASQSYEVMVCAHRANTHIGNNTGVPENSLSAIQKCIDEGIEMVELDVRTTKDGFMVLMHDAMINRTTNGTGYVKDKTLAELKALFLKVGKTVTTEKIPTLEEALEFGAGKVWFNLDLSKEINPARRVVNAVVNAGLIDDTIFFLSSNTEEGSKYLSFNDKVMLHLSGSGTSQINNYVNSTSLAPNIPIVQLSLDNTTTTNLPGLIQQGGKLLFVNSLETNDALMKNGDFSGIDEMLSYKIDIIQTDYGDLLIPYLKNKNLRK
jgi:glycerophosphoryl diester phosphodiesterase